MKKTISILLSAVLAIALVVGTLSAFAEEEKVSLEDWKGVWNSIEGYYDDPEVKEALTKVGEPENKTFEEVKKEKVAESHVDWLGLKIEGNTITFLDNFADRDGKEIETVEYEYVETKVVGEESDEHSQWMVFKAKGEAIHPLLVMMPVHGEDEITHFHIRYGEKVDEILAMQEWWPVMAKSTSTLEQVLEEVAH